MLSFGTLLAFAFVGVAYLIIAIYLTLFASIIWRHFTEK